MTMPISSVLAPAGPQSDRIETLWNWFLWIAVGVFALVVVALGVSVVHGVRARRSEGDGAPLDADPAQEKRLGRVIAAAVALTVITLATLLGATVGASRALAALDTRDAVRVKITGHQWWWEIEYEDPAPARTVITANELHVPVGRPVILDLTSADVIHSFWVPSLHGKRDLVPGRVNQTQLRVDHPGVYGGMCAEFCGLEHAKMALRVVAEPEADFDAWLAHQREDAPTPTAALTLQGENLFVHGTCAMCHAIAGTDAGATTGPDLTHVMSRGYLASNDVPNAPGWLAGWILDPQAEKPGVKMPPAALRPDDLAALLAYLETLR